MTTQSTNRFKSYWRLLIAAIRGKEEDFTTGSIRKAIFMLSIPMILEMLMESIFALVDIAYVSKVSVNAVATIGLTESVITLVYALAIGLSMAATAVVARRIGEKDVDGARIAAVQAISLGVVISIIIGIIGIIYAKDILALMGGEPDLIEQGYGYTQFLIGGNITVVLLFLINAIFRGAGNASIAMWALVLSNGLNIILDPIFIHYYEISGAAIATVISQIVVTLIYIYALLFRQHSYVSFNLADFRFNIKINQA